MKQLKSAFRSRSPRPPTPSQGSGAPSHNSDTLNSIIKVLEVAENALDVLPINAPKAVVSSIRSVLQSVKQSSDNQDALDQLHEQVRILDGSVLQPLLGCVEVPQAITPAFDGLRIKVEKAAEKRKRQSKRGRVMRTLLADQDANELQGFANDIKDALQVLKASTDVQRMIQQFENTASQILNKIPRAGGAGYDSERSNVPSRCLEDTRTTILEKIWCWIDRPVLDTVEPIYWINGLAGIGKSTIARTVAEDAGRRNLLGASFFFSRQEEDLSDARLFIPTIAYQLAQSYPAAKSMIVKILQKDPDIVKKSFATQIDRLILEPIRKITTSESMPVLFIVDALDECDNSADRATRLFRTVVARCTEVPSIRLLLTSRPETYIKDILMADGITGIVLHEDIEQSIVSGDIRKYLEVELSGIARRPGLIPPLPSSWPSEAELATLVDKAGKLFIWAATAVRFVGDRRGRSPTSRLNILLSSGIGLNMNTQNAYAALDNLYRAILSQAAEDLEIAAVQDIKITIGTIVRLHSEMPLEAIGRFLGDDTVGIALGRTQSIIPIPTNSSHPVQIYHPSFPDFITSWERCGDERFHVDVLDHEKRLALCCLDILNHKLSGDAEKPLKPTEHISALSKEAVLSFVPLEVQYACRFWAAHTTFQSVEHSGEDLVTRLEAFSSTMLLQWVVAMSILGSLSDAITATRTVQKWMDNLVPFSHLKERFYDAERMMVAYANIISEYPTQLYYSVLPFLPSDTYLSRQYPGRISILIGRENSWSPLLFKLPESAWSFGTCFSPDGDTLAVATSDGINLYDASNGLLNGNIAMPREGRYQHGPLQAIFTADGCKVFVLFRQPHYGGTEYLSDGIQTYDLAKQNAQLHFFPEKAGIEGPLLQLSGDGSYVVYPLDGLLNTRICIWLIESGNYASIPIGRGGKVRDLSLTGGSSHLVAVAMDDIIIIMDISSGHIRQRLPHTVVDNICFSHDGLFIASSSPDDTRLFSTTQGTLLATFEGGMTSLVFSRTNHLYIRPKSGDVRVYNALGDHNQPETRLIPIPGSIEHILPAPDDSQIVSQTRATLTRPSDIQMWSLRRFTDTHDSTPHANTILGIDLSHDASLLAIATLTEIEIWDARIGQRRDVIQTQSTNFAKRPVAFSPRGELIVSSSQDGIIVVDAQASVLRPTRYPFVREQGLNDSQKFAVAKAGISFDSSRIAAVWDRSNIGIWDLSSGTLLHAFDSKSIYSPFQWSRTDLYLLCKADTNRYLNPETFKDEIVEEPDDRFQEPHRLYHDGNKLRIRSSHWKNLSDDPLFLALPSHLNIKAFHWHGDRVCILSRERQLFLLEISYLHEGVLPHRI